MMKTPTAKKWFGAVLAAVTLTMVTSVAPASAAPTKGSTDTSSSTDSSTDGGKVVVQKRDTGWGGV
jgi:hypothetical protein